MKKKYLTERMKVLQRLTKKIFVEKIESIVQPLCQFEVSRWPALVGSSDAN